MDKETIVSYQPIQKLRRDYEKRDLPFDYHLNEAIAKATDNIKNESTKSIVTEVARLLALELKRCIKAKLDAADQREGTTWFGRFWRRLWPS